jgi:hypothetical protein
MFAWLRGASSSSAAAAADAVAQLQTTVSDASHMFRHGPLGLKLYCPPVFDCFPPTHAALSFICLADCHGCFPDIACTPPCDVLLVAGDFTLTGSELEVQLPPPFLQLSHALPRRCFSFTPGRWRASGATAFSCQGIASFARA